MANVKVYNMEGAAVGSMDLNDAVFAVEVNEHLMHMAVVGQLANKRQGTQSAKTRAEVSGGGAKPWKQKGTGHARQGSTRSPQWTGGGVVFAPKPKEYSLKMNKKEKAAAIKSALTSRVSEEKFFVIDELTLPEIKTKEMAKLLKGLNLGKALIITAEKNETIIASAKNIPDVRTTESGSISVFDILKYDAVVIAKDAVKKIEEVYA
ncbi:MAG: 50S ribosomal protein L4 [Lachnospiraceae bacterium]|nr:50S ribosomal protein L4 [Lachnospiraceae bacterium]